ncbi:MAG: hypothetical protein HC842_03095 [Cytophagales bacterium]|nr:hypothetical protein [Cytophagales bacterium]
MADFLSAEEWARLHDQKFLLSKRIIIQKCEERLWSVAEVLRPVLVELRSHGLNIPLTQPKVSKGDNYQGLPYLVLDFPRHFVAHKVFAFRTIIWWGHFFSFTLHLGGLSLEHFRETLSQTLTQKPQPDLYLSQGSDPWQHHYGPDNYGLLDEIDTERLRTHVKEQTFLKLSIKYDLAHLSELEPLACSACLRLFGLLSSNN